MEPDGGRINRQIVCSKNTPDDVRARLGELYDRQLDANTFQGSFGETLPKDVGGFGKYVHLDNPMGRVYVYVERLRGQDTQALEIEEAFSNADRLVDLLTEWLQTELGENPNFEKLRLFCDETLREDLKNLSLYSWVGGRASGEPDEAFIRVFLYLYERDYFTLDDIGRISTSTDKGEFALSYFRRMIAERLEYRNDKKAQEELDFLQDPNAVMESFKRFVASDELHDRLTREAREQSGDPDLVLDPCDVSMMMEDTSNMFFGMFFLDFFGSSGHKVKIRLICPGEPHETNGQWNERTGELSWHHQAKSDELPFICYASVVLANDSFQEQHLGKVTLRDEQLLQYSFWHKGLNPEQRTEWDDFITGLDGGEGVRSKVESFRFKSAAPSAADSDGAVKLLSDLPRDLIGRGLKANEQGDRELKSPQDTTKNLDQSFSVHPIGKVLKKDGKSFIVLDEKCRAGLKGLEKHTYVHVLYWFDKNDTPEKRAILEVYPRGDKSNPLTGVFATHSPFRPNLIAISRCDIVEIRENIIEVKEIDAFDGSPVLDLKGDFFSFHRPKTE
jgi:tRNA-Thr(GGU) m(6)t(6)A37 methyltransferase TsaA